ncbi:MAG: GTPase ObgE [Ruminococcaceae bacterium]|nr:GTPase ObgE [Oscillospiraceae bacterium]
MFVDIVKIHVKAGRGGDGAVSFHREKYIAAGGPDGGDGGRGGNVVFIADNHMSSLMDFRYTRKYVAGNGENGRGGRCYGKSGQDVIVKVPRGTLIREQHSGALIKDLSDNEPFIVARGGRGGWGNSHFANPRRQVPRFAHPGLEGESFDLTLELKLLADVGLIGFPNVGKSTLLSVISAARPKIANYHFTTLVPNLGVVSVDEVTSFVAADIPGLIEGAGEGAGLGHYFLRHVERCRLLLHLVDVSCIEGRDPIEDFETINRELAVYSEALSHRPQIVVANKTDIIQDEEAYQRFRAYIEEKGLPYFEISAATTAGVRDVVREAARQLSELPPVIVFEPEYVPPMIDVGASREIEITCDEGVYYVEGTWLERLIQSTNFTDYESRMFFDKALREAGVYDKLEEMGINEGDTVDVEGYQFDYIL